MHLRRTIKDLAHLRRRIKRWYMYKHVMPAIPVLLAASSNDAPQAMTQVDLQPTQL
jgi:hypothetical protein